MHPPKQLRQSFCSRSVFQKNRPQRWDRADGQAFDDLSLPEKCAPIAHGSEGRAYSSPSNPGRAASPIYSNLICDRHNRLQSNIEVPWLTIEAALDEVEKLLEDDTKNVEFLSEVGDWLRALTPLQPRS